MDNMRFSKVLILASPDSKFRERRTANFIIIWNAVRTQVIYLVTCDIRQKLIAIYKFRLTDMSEITVVT
jgi:hypothetical protein